MQAALLDNHRHRDLKLRSTPRAEWGDNQAVLPTVPSEFRLLQAHYPIVFQAAAAAPGGFQPMVLMGLEPGRNLFLGPEGWDAHHLPHALERQPLLVGRDGEDWLVHIDLDSPRLSSTEGEPLFLPQGGQSPLLQRRVAVLQALHEGLQALPAFIEALLAHQLLEPLNLDIPQADGSLRRFAGFHVVHEERLAALDAASAGALHAAGHLLPLHMAVASLGRLRDLVEREQRAG